MVKRWHDEMAYGRNSEHCQYALDVNIGICVPLHLLASKGLYYYRSRHGGYGSRMTLHVARWGVWVPHLQEMGS